MERPNRRLGKYLDCPVCGKTFYRKRGELKPVNYCSYYCIGRASIERGSLRPAPKGARRSPATEFKRGTRPANHLPVGTERLRTRQGRDDPRWFVKVAEPNVWKLRAVHVWESMHGPLPKGRVVHHINRDKLDDRIENLKAMSRAAHLAEHRADHATTSKNMPQRSSINGT